MKPVLTLALIVALIASCSSTPNIPDRLNPEFKTRITVSGLKHFQLQLVPKAHALAEPSLRRNPNTLQQPPMNADKQARKTEKLLVAQAQLEIGTLGYCREGFWLLDKNLYGNAPYIRGECNDTASSEDRENFPDTLLRW